MNARWRGGCLILAAALITVIGFHLKQRAELIALEKLLSESPIQDRLAPHSILSGTHEESEGTRNGALADSDDDVRGSERESLDQELERLRREPPPLNRTLIELRLSQLSNDEMLDAFAFLERHSETGRATNEMWHLFWKRWGQLDPEGALSKADDAIPIYHERDRVRKHIFEGFAEIDPEKAAALIVERPQMTDRHRAIEGLSVKWAHSDPEAATDWALDHLEGKELWNAVGGIPWGINATQGHQEALAWWNQLPNQEVKAHAFRSLSEIYSSERYQATAEDRQSLWNAGADANVYRTDLTARVALDFIENDPEAGIALFSQEEPSNSGFYEGVSLLIQNWTQRDPESAGNWLATQQNEPWLDSAIWSYATQIRSLDAEAAEAWVSRMKSDALRSRLQP